MFFLATSRLRSSIPAFPLASRNPSISNGAYGRRFCLLLALLAGVGCESTEPTHSAAVRARVTPADPKLATADYWWDQPPTATASAADFDRLWAACEAEVYVRLFRVDREEYRLGLLTTLPVISKQIFEPWRTDGANLHDVAESTLATVRRTLRFEIRKRPDGSFQVTPKVLVERFASTERRLTAFSQYHEAFSGPRAFSDSPDLTGDALTQDAQAEYWYALHRDAALEHDLADAIAGRLRG